MTRIAKTNTYTRIIDASLTLFNEEGERNISTNHIAAHLGISPGNLYYHFRNKDEIIVQLFKRYSEALLAYLMKPCCRPMWKIPSTIWQAFTTSCGNTASSLAT